MASAVPGKAAPAKGPETAPTTRAGRDREAGRPDSGGGSLLGQAVELLNALPNCPTKDTKLTALLHLKELIARDPALAPALLPELLPLAMSTFAEVRRWLVSFLEWALTGLGKPRDSATYPGAPTTPGGPANNELSTQILLKATNTMAYLLMNDESNQVIKQVIQFIAVAFPLAVQHLTMRPQDSPLWSTMQTIKSKILTFLDSKNEGLVIYSLKFQATLVVVQSAKPQGAIPPPGVVDISILDAPPGHPFILHEPLQVEAAACLSRLLGFLHSSTHSSTVLTASLTCLPPLLRARPQFLPNVLNVILPWHKSMPPHLSPTATESVRRTMLTLLKALLKNFPSSPFETGILEALGVLGVRSGTASAGPFSMPSLKRPRDPRDPTAPGVKRVRSDADMDDGTPPPSSAATAPGAVPPGIQLSADEFTQVLLGAITSLPVPIVMDLVTEGLKATPPEIFVALGASLPAIHPLLMSTVGTGPSFSRLQRFIQGGMTLVQIIENLPAINETLRRERLGQVVVPPSLYQGLPPDEVGLGHAEREPDVSDDEDESENIKMEEMLAKRIDEELKKGPLPATTTLPKRKFLGRGDSGGLSGAASGAPGDESLPSDGPDDTLLPLTDFTHPFELPAPSALSASQRKALIMDTFERIMDLESSLSAAVKPLQSTALAGNTNEHDKSLDALTAAMKDPSQRTRTLAAAKSAWQIILARMTTRSHIRDGPGPASGDTTPNSLKEADAWREHLLDFVAADFRKRHELLQLWLHEEYFLGLQHHSLALRTRPVLENSPLPSLPPALAAMLGPEPPTSGIPRNGNAPGTDADGDSLMDKENALGSSPSTEGPAFASTYRLWFSKTLARLVPALNDRDRTITKFLVEAPSISDDDVEMVVLELIGRPGGGGVGLGVSTLRDVILWRKGCRGRLGVVLEQLCLHKESSVRLPTILVAKKLVENNPQLEAFGIKNLEALKEPFASVETVEPEDEDVKMEDGLEPLEPAVKPELPAQPSDSNMDSTSSLKLDGPSSSTVSGSVGTPASGSAAPAPLSVGPSESSAKPTVPKDTRGWKDDDIRRYLDLYFALCHRKNDLLKHLFQVFALLPKGTQDVIREHIVPLIKSLKESLPLMALTQQHPKGSEELLVRIVRILIDSNGNKPPPALIPTLRTTFESRPYPLSLLLLIIPFLDSPEIRFQFPKLFPLFDNSESRKALLRSLLAQLCTAVNGKKALYEPDELIVDLHLHADKSHGAGAKGVGTVKRIVEVIGVCFTLPDLFTRDTFLKALGRMVTSSLPVPLLFARTLLQLVMHHPASALQINPVLSKLISKRIWEKDALWNGFIRIVKQTAPTSFPIAIQLDVPQLKAVLAKHPDLVAPLQAYIEGLDPARVSAKIRRIGDVLRRM